MLMALGVMGVVCITLLSIVIAIRHGKASSFLETIVYGVSNNLLQKRFIALGYILSWGIFLSGFIMGLLVT